MSDNPSKHHRVYIKNLNYETSEGDLEELLKKYEPYTIHFSRSGRHRPLGIAYAEFKNQEQLEAVIKEFDGYVLQNRKITVKKHLPYNPGNHRFSLKSNKQESSSSKNGSDRRSIFSNNDKSVNSPEADGGGDTILSGDGGDGTGVGGGSSSNTPMITIVNKPFVLRINENTSSSTGPDRKKSISRSELSSDTILIPKAHGKITDARLREFFKEYHPTQIYIFRTRKAKLNPINLASSHVSVLATVDASQTKLEDIIKNLKGQKLDGKHITLKPAYLSKIAEVERAATRLGSLEVIEGTSSKNDTNDIEDRNNRVDRVECGCINSDDYLNESNANNGETIIDETMNDENINNDEDEENDCDGNGNVNDEENPKCLNQCSEQQEEINTY